MDISTLWDSIQLSDQTKRALLLLAIRLGILASSIVIAIIVGRLLPWILRITLSRTLSNEKLGVYQSITSSLEQSASTTVILILTSVSLNIVRNYRGFYRLVSFFVDAAMTVSIAWLLSRICKQIIRLYGVSLIGRISDEINDVILIFETIVNVLIGFFAAMIFAQTRNFNFLALLTGLGIGAAGVAFAAQEALGQVIGTIVLYLDRPYVVGEYVRVNFNVHAEDVYGRIESIGIRSTKIRVAVSNTLVIVPNSVMAKKDIENISRGSKVMVLIYIDFPHDLSESEQALVSQIIEKSIASFFGIDPGSTRIHLFCPDDKNGTRARVSFFMMGTSESSLKLRKQLLRLSNDAISRELKDHNFKFLMQEPTVYVDSPVTL